MDKARQARSDARLVAASARHFLRWVQKQSGKRRLSLADWLKLFAQENIVLGPMLHCPASFTARIVYCEEYDFWLVAYNGRDTGRQIERYLCHEFIEYLAVTDHLGTFDALPGVWAEPSASGDVYCYDGGVDPGAIHHRIARRVEDIYFRRG